MKKRKRIAFLLIAVAAAMILFGAGRGEAGIILNKAVNICLQCIGIG